jgi:hypothetical protein
MRSQFPILQLTIFPRTVSDLSDLKAEDTPIDLSDAQVGCETRRRLIWLNAAIIPVLMTPR